MTAGPAGGSGPALADGVVLVMPYGRWRRWVRTMRARGGRRQALADGGDPHDRAYLVYGLTLVVLMYAPILWSALARLAAPLGADPALARGGLVLVGTVVVGLAGLGGVLLHRFGMPLWVTSSDAVFTLSGAWDARAVLWRRVLVLVAATAVLAGLVGSAVAAGALAAAGADGTFGTFLAWGACAAGAAMLPLALAVAAQCPRRRAVARAAALVVALGGVLAGLRASALVDDCSTRTLVAVMMPAPGVSPASDALVPPACTAPLGPPVEVIGWAVALAVVSVGLLLAVLPRHLDVDATAAGWQRVVVTGAGLQGGDATGLRSTFVPTRRSDRLAVSLAPRLLVLSPVLARDVLGLQRRPGAVLGSVVCGALGVLLVTAAGELGPFAAVAGAVVLYATSSTWTTGLRAMASQPVPGGLLPGATGRQVGAHLLVPGGLALVVAACGLGLAAVAGAPGAATAVVVVAVLVTVLAARAWVAGASTVPAALFTPVPGPTGDLAMVSVATWYLRGWLVVAGVAWAADRWGAVVALAVAGLTWLLVRSAVRRLARE